LPPDEGRPLTEGEHWRRGGAGGGAGTGPRPGCWRRSPLLRVGDEVEVGGAVRAVTGLSGSAACLADGDALRRM
jgi:hypothetical protein